MVWVLHDTVDNRVAEVHVWASHVNLGTEHHLAFFDFAGIHLFEESQAFFYRTVAVRAFSTRLGRRPLLRGDVFRRLFVDISLAFLDKLDGEVPQLLEIIGCIIFISPLEAEPLDIFLDGFYVFHVFLGRVSVVETEITYSTITGCNTKIQANSLGVSDMEIAVWFWRETGLYSISILTFAEVFLYGLFNEVQTLLFCNFVCVHFSHIVIILFTHLSCKSTKSFSYIHY